MNECEHNTATVLHDFGKFSILKCDWGCNEFLIELELGKNAVTTFTASELLHLRRVAAAKDAEIARLKDELHNQSHQTVGAEMERDELIKAAVNLFQACSDLPLPEMDRMEKEINAMSAALRGEA